MAIEALKFNNINLASNPIANKALESDNTPVFGNALIGGTEDTFASDATQKQVELQAQELVRLVKGLNPENKDSIMKKVVENKIKALKELAEATGIDLNEVFSEVMANMSRNDQKKVSKALKVKISKVQPKVEEAETQPAMANPFGNTALFSGFASQGSSSFFNTRTDLPELTEAGYDKDKATNLARAAANGAGAHSQRYCAKYVSNAIARAGISSQRGHAYQMANILADNKNFNEIDAKGMDLSKLPAGCVVVYDKGAAGYSSQYGHIAITLGDGRAASDFVQKRLPQSDRVRVYVPV